MTRNSGGEVTIYLYHVVDGGGIHRFRTTNSRFVEHLGGIGAVEARLGSQFQFVELIGTCPFRVGNDAGESGFDDIAGNEIATRIKVIAHQYPDCDPLPQPWSEGESRKDLAQAVCRSITGSIGSLEKEIIEDLVQIQDAVAGDIEAVVALIYYSGGFRASLVQRDAKKAGLAVHDGGVPADHVAMISVPDPTQHSGKWIAIPPAKLSIPLVPPDEDQPVAYLVICEAGRHALALAGRRNAGRVGWSGNADLIDGITQLLADIGVLKLKRRSAPPL